MTDTIVPISDERLAEIAALERRVTVNRAIQVGAPSTVNACFLSALELYGKQAKNFPALLVRLRQAEAALSAAQAAVRAGDALVSRPFRSLAYDTRECRLCDCVSRDGNGPVHTEHCPIPAWRTARAAVTPPEEVQ